MNTITAEQIAVNRYAPQGAQAINLYATDTASGLTLGQLVASVCLRTGAVLEARSISKMNAMNLQTTELEKMSGYVSDLAQGNVSNWSEMRAYFVGQGVSSSDLPQTVDTYAKRMQAIDAVKTTLDSLTKLQQEDMIDVQTLVNRRDNAYSTATNTVKALGTIGQDIAQNF